MEINKLKSLIELLDDNSSQQNESHPFEIGKVYFIRTVTYHLTGRLKSVYKHELVLTEAAWIADSGRFADALKNEKFEEVEPFPSGRPVIVGRGAIIDATPISAPQLTQK